MEKLLKNISKIGAKMLPLYNLYKGLLDYHLTLCHFKLEKYYHFLIQFDLWSRENFDSLIEAQSLLKAHTYILLRASHYSIASSKSSK